MNVMLLAAGRSTRLGALGLTLPKPLVPVCGHPAIHFGLHAAARAGATRVVVNVFHRGDLLRAALGDGRALGLRIDYSVEDELLGTGGGLARARALFGPGPVLAMNAKVVADLDLPALLAVHGDGAAATMLLRDDPDPERWGAVGVDATGRVVRILDAHSPRRRRRGPRAAPADPDRRPPWRSWPVPVPVRIARAPAPARRPSPAARLRPSSRSAARARAHRRAPRAAGRRGGTH